MSENRNPLRWLLILTGVAAVIIVAIVAWSQIMNAMPVVKIPTPVMPSPNAHDFYVDAANALRDGRKILYASSDAGMPVKPSKSDPYERRYTLAEKDEIVSHNALALKTLRRGFAYPYMAPPIRSFRPTFPPYAKFRDLARVLRIE